MFKDAQKSYFGPPRDIADTVTPYIGLRARLSQVWINQYTIILILVIIKLVIFRVSLKSSLETAEKYTLSSCRSAENMGSSAASMPHYLALGANSLIDTGLTSAREGLIQALMLSLTILEQLLLFVINMMVGTYACLLTVAVDTAANTAINATEAVVDFVDNSLTTVIDGIEDGVDALEKVINSISKAFNSIAKAFSDDNASSLIGNVTLSIGSLKNLTIPTSINSKLEALRSEIPDYSDVKNATSKVISIPFDLLKTEINDTLLQKSIPFNTSAIAIPAQQTITFCSNGSGIADFYEKVSDGIVLLSKIFIIILAVTAVCVCVPAAIREIKEWRWIQHCAENVQEIYDSKVQAEQEPAKPSQILNRTSNQRIDNIEIIESAAHKWVTRIQLFAARRFSDLTQKTLVKWWVGYVLYPPALLVLTLGLCGLFVTVVQFIIFAQVKESLPALEKGMNAAAADVLVDVQEGISNWANTTNKQIMNVQNDINENLLGWIYTATGSINDTLGVFSTSMNKELDSIFGDTPFYTGITGVVYCVIGSKIETVQKGIAWVHNHTQVTLPTVTSDFVSPSALTNGSDTSSSSLVARSESIESFTDSAVSLMASALKSLIETYEKSLYLELKISIVLLSIWLLVALTGFVYCWVVYRRTVNSIPDVKHFTHAKSDSSDSDWDVCEKEQAGSGDGSPSRDGMLRTAAGFKSTYRYCKDRIMKMAPPPLAFRPGGRVKEHVVFNGPTNSSFGNLSIDKEWQKFNNNNNNNNNRYSSKTIPATPIFRPPSLLACETPRTPCQPRSRDTYAAWNEAYREEETPMTPTAPLPVYQSPCQKPKMDSSPDRKSQHAVRGYM